MRYTLSQPEDFRVSALCSLQVRLLVLTLTTASKKEECNPGRTRSLLPPEAERDELLQRLSRGDSTGFASQSSADFVLVLKLLHWTGDNIELTRQLFRESGLFREKTERKTGSATYLDMTIANAIKKRRNPPMKR